MKNRIVAILSIFMASVFVGCGNNQTSVDSNPMQDVVADLVEDESSEAEVVEDVAKENVSEIEKSDHSKLSLDSLDLAEDGTGVAVYDGVKHDIIMCSPESLETAPLVIMLHGYGESASAFMHKTAFEQEANSLGYVVVYVTGARKPDDVTASVGWNSGIGMSSNKDVDFLCALANDLCKNYSLDANRVFAVGFSNGAFMTHRLALEADDIFAAIVSVAGMMPEKVWGAKPKQCEIGILQITGEKDDVVPKNINGSAEFFKAPAIEDVIEYYVEKNGVSLSDTVSIGKKSTLAKYTSSNSKKQVWNILIPDGRHSWPEESIVGFNTNQIILEFLETE